MVIKSLLCPISGSAADRPALETASALAMRFGAHVEVLHARPDAAALVPYFGEGMSPAVIGDLMADAEKRVAERAALAKATFDSWSQERRIALRSEPGAGEAASCSWREAVGAEDSWIARRGRVADLTVIRTTGAELSVDRTLAFEAALLDTGRPVLLAPEGGMEIGGPVVIAWNGSAESSRAVAGAMPLLAVARAVHAVSVEESGREAEPSALAEYLAWHRIPVQAHKVAGRKLAAERVIEDKCAEVGASLLVMGGYTHSRLRELVFGGVTAHMMRHPPRPILMAH